MEWGTPVWWGRFLLFCVPQSVKTKETNPTRPGSPTPCKEALSLEKEKDIVCVVFTYFIKRACEMRKFYVAGVQRRQRNVQNSVMHVQSCFFVNKNRLLFCRSPCRRRRREFSFHPEIVLPWWRDVTLLLSITLHVSYLYFYDNLFIQVFVYHILFVYLYHFKCCNSLFYSHLAFLAPDESWWRLVLSSRDIGQVNLQPLAVRSAWPSILK